MKSILKSILLTILLLSLSEQLPQPVSAHEPIIYNTIVTNTTTTSLVYVTINDKQYSFENEDDSWNINDKITITLKDNEVIQARAYVTNEQIKKNMKIETSTTTYINKLTTDVELTQYAQQWLKDNYNDTLTVPITFNNIKQDDTKDYIIEGQTFFTDNQPTKIIINPRLANESENMITERVLIHELTHYILAKQGFPYMDGTTTFTDEALKNGASINDSKETKGVLYSHVKIVQEF